MQTLLEKDCPWSTILRVIRRFENLRSNNGEVNRHAASFHTSTGKFALLFVSIYFSQLFYSFYFSYVTQEKSSLESFRETDLKQAGKCRLAFMKKEFFTPRECFVMPKDSPFIKLIDNGY